MTQHKQPTARTREARAKRDRERGLRRARQLLAVMGDRPYVPSTAADEALATQDAPVDGTRTVVTCEVLSPGVQRALASIFPASASATNVSECEGKAPLPRVAEERATYGRPATPEASEDA